MLSSLTGLRSGWFYRRVRHADRIADGPLPARRPDPRSADQRAHATPNVALIPLLILWFGLGLLSKIVIIFLAGFFPIIVNTYAGVRNVGRGLVEVALAEGASEAQVFTKIVVPASLPFITTGVRLAMGRAVVAMVVAELFTALSGLGGAIMNYGNAFKTDKLFVIIIVLALLGVGLTESVRGWKARAVERNRECLWKPMFKTSTSASPMPTSICARPRASSATWLEVRSS